MSKYESREDLRDNCVWEGGPAEFIFGYGLDPDDLPDETPRDVRHAVRNLRRAVTDLNTLSEWLYGGEEDS